MVNKTLLSLAIAVSTAGLTACNLSSTADNDSVLTNPVTAGTASNPGLTTPIFSAANSQLPLANDLLFAINSQLEDGQPGKDGTANTADTTPPVTTALNKLDGFSTSAAHYINFTAALNPATVIAGQTVFLVKLKNGTDSAAINPLDLQSIIDNGGASPFSASQPVDNSGNPLYEANYITLDGGATHTIQILPKTPLDPKTKYFIVLTDSIKGSDGKTVGESSEYTLLTSNLALPSPALEPVRTAIKGWETLSGLFLAGATNNAITQDNIVLSYAFTTTGTTDVLHAMAAPGTFLTTQIPSIAHAEGAISLSLQKQGANPATIDGTLLQIAQGVATAINTAAGGTVIAIDDKTRSVLKASDTFSPSYKKGLIGVIADGSGAGLDTIIDKPQSRTYTPIVSAPNTAVAVPYDALLTAQITTKVKAQVTDITTAEGAISLGLQSQGADPATINGTLLQIAHGVATAINEAAGETLIAIDEHTRTALTDSEPYSPNYLTGLQTTIVNGQVAALSSKGSIYQGGLTLPNYLPNAEAGVADNALGSWTGSNNAALALGLTGAPTDVNGEINVSYRFPFADKVGDNTIPVMVTLPKDDCDPDGAGPANSKPADGWPVAIYQHGITVDRTAGLLVGNTLAGQCIAMIAIDHAMHGIAPLNSGGANSLRLFNVEQVAASEAASSSPFAAARAGWINAVGAENAPELAALAERHNNVAKNAFNTNIDMVFKGALDSEGRLVTAESVGTSGQLYINLNNFTRTRDGIRQTILDMLNIGASIGDMDINADGTADDLDPSKVYFIGHSLGGIVGATFLAVNNNADVRAYNSNLPKIQAAALGNPGGGFVKLLENSPSIGARVLGGLQAASGITQGSESIEKFFSIFQATVDSADPINFATDTHDIPVLVYTDVGGLASAAGDDDDGALSDQVVPNNALTPALASSKSYLAGTDALVREMGITTLVNKTNAVAGGPVTADPKYYFPNATNDSLVRANIRFTQGTHSTFSSADPKDVFAETYQQIITFFDPYGVTKLLGLPGDQKGFVIENTTALEKAAE
jgi:hypothetical protein